VRTLVTGGAGFIGQHVVRELLARGHEVRILDSLRADVHGERPWTPAADVAFQQGDVRDSATIDRALSGIDGVLHLAAKVGLGVDVGDLPDYASSNDVGTAELLAGMARAGVGRLVLASSMVVYGEGVGTCAEHGAVSPAPRREEALVAGQFEPPCPVCGKPLAMGLVSESAAIDPRNAYASSKVVQEFYAANWARTTGGSVAAMRYHNVYGPGMPHNTPYAGVAAIFTSALRQGKAPQVFEDGGQRRDFVHVRDVAAATVAACEMHGAGVRAFNVGSGTPRTVGDMAVALATAIKGPKPMVTGQFRLGDVRHITADSSRLRDELGWRPQIAFAAGMEELASTI
jgi:dTDP-L-rhamnose 4-epimerase